MWGGGSLCVQSPRALLEFGRRKSARVPQTCRERLWQDCDASAVMLWGDSVQPICPKESRRNVLGHTPQKPKKKPAPRIFWGPGREVSDSRCQQNLLKACVGEALSLGRLLLLMLAAVMRCWRLAASVVRPSERVLRDRGDDLYVRTKQAEPALALGVPDPVQFQRCVARAPLQAFRQ